MTVDLNRSAHRFLWWCLVPVLCGTALVALGLAASYFSTAYWIGSKSLDVVIHVFNADSGSPIANSTIALFEGPAIPREAPPSIIVSEIKRHGDSRVAAITDHEGAATITHSFVASGRSYRRNRTGNVRLSEWWVEVNAPGHSTVLIPLDSAGRTRRLDDESPVFVNVGLSIAD